MQSLIFKSLLSVGMIVLFAGDCNPTPDPIAGQALFKKLAFTVDKVNYDFDFEAEPAPGTLAINNSTPTNLANALQAGSGYTLVADGKTYGIAYKNINDTVYLTLTLPEDVTTLPTGITLNTLSVSEKSTLVDQNGASITEGQSLSRRNDAFITKIISEDGKKNTIYNIQLKLNENTPQTPTITKLALISSLENGEDLSVDLTAMTVMVPAGVSISTKVFIKELVTSSNDVRVFDKDGKALGENSEIVIEDHTLTLKVGFSADNLDKTYTLQIRSPAPAGAVLSSLTLSYLNLEKENIELVGKSGIIELDMGQRMPSEVTINSYQLADDSKEATVSVTSGGDALKRDEKVTLDGADLKLYVTPSEGGTATEYTITFREALRTGSTLMSLTLTGTGTDIEEVIRFTATQTQAMISLPSTVPDQVTVSELVVSEGATVTVGGEMIQTGQEKEINFNGSPIIFKVTSQSGISTDYTIVFDLQNILKSLVLEVAGETVELKGKAGEPSTWIGEIEFYNAFTGSNPVRIETLELSDGNKARIKKDAGYEEIMINGSITLPESSSMPNEFTATLEVYVEGDDMDKETYTLIIRKKSLMMKSYSQEELGTEIPTLGIALLDTLKDPNNPTEGFDYPALTISGLKKETNYKFKIGDDESQLISSTAEGELILMKTHLTYPLKKVTTTIADISLLSSADADLGVFGRYEKLVIRDWKDLQGMRMDLGASYTLENDIVLPTPGEEGLPQKGFEPIGTLITNTNGSINDKSTPFTGKLNVVDKEVDPNKIMGLSIDRSSEDGVGLFGYVKDAEIRNLMIEITTVIGKENTGALVGLATGSTIEDVGVTGGAVEGTNYVGGLVGDGTGTITSCYATGDVTGTEGSDYVGGLVGNGTGTITSCYATGDVNGRGQVGGLVGDGTGTITSCYATGDVNGRGQVGGLVGYNRATTITSCYATGAVTGHDRVGGLVGDGNDTITSCYATGDVTGTGDSEYVGGLVGYNHATITSCYATGAVNGRDQVGGLVGNNNAAFIIAGTFIIAGSITSNAGTITSCYATGAVNGRDQVGGLVGNNDGTTTSCYYDKETTGKDDTGVGQGSSNGVMGLAKSDIKTDTEGNPFILDKPDTEAVEGFNFVTVWKFEEGKWPKLTWETNQGL